MGGSGGSEEKCGPITHNHHGVFLSLPTPQGSQTLPSGQTETWEAFDVGIAAFPPSVGQIRLVSAGGSQETIMARRVPKTIAFKNAEPFHYAVFAVYGCVSEVQGLTNGQVVARVHSRPSCRDMADE
jgi:hypothetical protein